ALARGALAVPLAPRRVRERRRPPCRARARGAVGAADDALRPRLPEDAADRAVLVSQARARMPSRRARRPFRPPLPARHGGAAEGVRSAARTTYRGGPARRRPRARAPRNVRGGGHVAAVPGPDRLPRAAPVRVRAA